MQRTSVTISFGKSLGTYSPCSSANGDVGNLTLKYNFILTSSSFGYAAVKSTTLKDLETGHDVDDAVALGIKWLIQPCVAS